MKVDDWKAHVTSLQAAQSGMPPPPKEAPPPPPLDTGLTPKQEMMLLSHLITPQKGLEKFGYVTSVPSEAEIEQAKAGNAASDGWEKCDRCSTRFQVFPDRREDGALTSGKQCAYHWGKLLRPAYKKTEAITGRAEPTYTCCHELGGSPGCTVKDTHVFKISEAKRLAMVLPFISTPPNPKARKDQAVSFDCEMGYTVYGFELIRLTATSWPDGAPLIDVLVRPLGAVLDLNTRFSGVSPELFFNALDYDAKDSLSSSHAGAGDAEKPTLRIVSSPVRARDLLLSHISPETPLIGHGIENDLNTVRLVHPAIVDTTALYPHPRGLPFRLSLRHLTKQMLSREIQTAGAAGHDSLEDARATGDLVRVKVGKEWRKLKHDGWTVIEEGFCPPVPPGSGGVPKPADLPTLGSAVLGKTLKKRKRTQTEGADDEAEDSPGR
ncbi:uncharacterized protein K452DRAFT_288694 [Aplosporella prunicola CBS 121167]|uniref:Exonuclease domain-containing protein n=1 Tax=Aplosporella prunicola CBS 121167 TaxID=1176127 RepID=A0A6A6BB64_9PEZI|nr:uncharacterized protein K452DRAFT_288694 [Aplosporella prunicola CBS 121167]KAF2140603.1 hypothetical protein K452DRAFT_288694 [Aplosporella prunicola CBS 121167]